MHADITRPNPLAVEPDQIADALEDTGAHTMPSAEVIDEINWAKLFEAAAACGIDGDTLASPQTMDARRKASEPELVPELEAPSSVRTDEWDVISPLMPPRTSI